MSSGEPHTLSDEVLYPHLVNRAVFSVSSGRFLVTQTGKGAALSRLTWFDPKRKTGGHDRGARVLRQRTSRQTDAGSP